RDGPPGRGYSDCTFGLSSPQVLFAIVSWDRRGKLADGADFFDELRVFRKGQRLRAVGKSKLRLIVNFDHEAVRSHCDSGARERGDHVRGTSAVRWIDDDRQMRNAPDRRHRGEV